MRLATTIGRRLSDTRHRNLWHFLLLCGLLAVTQLPVEITPRRATLLVMLTCVLLAAIAALAVVSLRRITELLPTLGIPYSVGNVSTVAVRLVGLPVIAFCFFLFWTIVYIATWRVDPTSWRGLGAPPHFGDFAFYAVMTGFISPPGDILVTGGPARAATMIEMLTGISVIAGYAGAFMHWRRDIAPLALLEDETPPSS